MLRFWLASGTLAIFIFAAMYSLESNGVIAAFPTWWLETLLLMVVLTCAVYYYLTRPTFAAAHDFSWLYLASIALKVLCGCSYLVVVLVNSQTGALQNAVFFLTSYLLFTGLEVAFLWSRIQSQNGVKKG